MELGAALSIASVQQYIQSLLQGLIWPAAMTGLPPLAAYITPPDPNVQSEIPAAYIWMQRGRESRDTDRLRTGTVPRAATPGAPSGTKAEEYTIPVYLVWMMSAEDPDADNLFPGMVWAVMKMLRGGSYTADGISFSESPKLLTDPWDGEQSWLIDLGEDMTWDTDFRALEDQRFLRYDAVVDCSVSEVIAA